MHTAKLIAVMAAALAHFGSGIATPVSAKIDPRMRSVDRRSIPSKIARINPPYAPKTPQTGADLKRWADANLKRRRRANRRVRNAIAGGYGPEAREAAIARLSA